ncbi:hypothetical protein [Falsiroseomonas oryzae]|uniref:hypothetical protein n=1 Tax=Falsiroseomonas oryzae TaxID=2766473 RepID=UPI0022EA44CF|nr:hypothetical protein [Roseomonas sp. MO-31]
MPPTGPYGNGPSSPGDPTANLFGAMRDMWELGFGVLQAMAGAAALGAGGHRPATSFGFQPGAEPQPGASYGYQPSVAYQPATSHGAQADGGPETPNAAEALRSAARQVAEVSPAMAEAASIAAASSLRYWRGLADVFARHQGTMMQAATARMTGDAALPPEQCHVLTENLRSFLREVGDTAMLEARRLEHELEQVSERLARSAASPDPDAPYLRRWSAKP